MQKNFVRAVSQGPLDPSARTWPGAPELTLLRLVGLVWSTSDLSHPVAAPALLLISQYLAQARVRTVADLASGLFLCSLASQYEAESKRLVPEVVNFLLNALLLICPSSFTAKTVPGSFPCPDLGQDYAKGVKLRQSSKGRKSTADTVTIDNLAPRATLNFAESLSGTNENAQIKIDLVAATARQLNDFAEKYVSSEAFIEVFEPCHLIVGKLANNKHLPASLKVCPRHVTKLVRQS